MSNFQIVERSPIIQKVSRPRAQRIEPTPAAIEDEKTEPENPLLKKIMGRSYRPPSQDHYENEHRGEEKEDYSKAFPLSSKIVGIGNMAVTETLYKENFKQYFNVR